MKKEGLKKEDIIKMTEEEHKAYHRRLIYVFLMIMIVLFGGATFYYYVEEWSYLDSLYFTSSTMTTVGYGDITPKTVEGKVFTIFYLFIGVGVALYGLTLMAAHFVEVREEFFLERIGKIRLRHHTETLWEKIKNAFSYKPEALVKEYENSSSYTKKKE